MCLVVKADAQTEAALLEVLESFSSGFAARDAEGVMQLFAPDSDVVMVTSEESVDSRPPPRARMANPCEKKGAANGSRYVTRRNRPPLTTILANTALFHSC